MLQAAPGAGKTTRVPRALLEQGLAGTKEVVVLEPRRLATRMAAQRVAEELGETVGQRVGYQVRFEDVSSAKTRLRFVTEGVLTRRLINDPTLRDVGVVVLDEFHERHLAGDLALALLRRLQTSSRPDLKIILMSATLETRSLADYLGDAPVLTSEGRRFAVDIQHLPTPDERHLDHQVLAALKRLVPVVPDGHVLVFLPGAGEIRRARDTCQEFAERHGLAVHALHGDLSSAEQDDAVRASPGRKLILSTNVAETSVTIDGVSAVIDSGVARVASFSPWSGLPALKVAKVSKASAIQRAGRAGRTRAGICVRLYTQHDFDGRPDHDAPEIRRLDLTDTVLALRSLGVTDLGTFPFFEAPPRVALEAAELLLRRLGAVSTGGEVTATGRRLLKLSVHPRLARVIAEGERRGVAREAVVLAALLGERDIRRESRTELRAGSPGPGRARVSGASDLLEMLERFQTAERAGFASGKLSGLHLDTQAVHAVDRVRKQLSRGLDTSVPAPRREADHEQALLLSVLAGFPDRVARRRKPHMPELLLTGGGTAQLSEASVVQEPELLVALDAEERSGPSIGKAGGSRVMVRIASKVEPEWLLDLYPDALTELDALEWNAGAERVERVTRLSYENLVLEETRTVAPPSDGASKVLATEAERAGFTRFAEPERIEHWSARLELVAGAFPEAHFPAPDAELFHTALRALAEGRRSFAELREGSLFDGLQAGLTPDQQRLLATVTPERVALPGGRQLPVHYERGKGPWIESRLQDFFGLLQGPSVCQGRVPLVLHLLAPNQRAVQVTTDLAGFWDRHYPSIRRELARKYPRHAWPEDPRNAQPPVSIRKRA